MSDRARPITRRDVIEHLRAHDCAPSDGPVKVGLEQEWHTYDLAQPGRHLLPRRGARRRHRRRAAARREHDHGRARGPGGAGHAAHRPVVVLARRAAHRRRRGAPSAGRRGDGRAGGRHRPVPRARPHAHQAALRRHAGLLRRVGPRGPTDDVELRVDPGEHRLRRRRRRSPAAGTWPTASGPRVAAAFACSPAPLHRSERLAIWNAMDPTRTKPVLRVGPAGRGLERLRAGAPG